MAALAELGERIFERRADDGTCGATPAIPGVGPGTARAPAACIGISAFSDRARLAGCRGTAPARRAPGTSIRSVRPQRGGGRCLRNLLIFSCNSPVGTGNRFGEHCGACTAGGMRRNRALKAVARKRMKVIHAIMRDKVRRAA